MLNTNYDGKHLTLAERINIKKALADKLSIKLIVLNLSKRPATISK